MRVYISVDMEGVAGVVHEDQTNPMEPRCAPEYARFRRLMTAEANAAVQGAVDAGATRVLVNDSHWTMRNLLAEELHEVAELVSGGPKPRSMMEGIDGGFDAALCIGYHARAGTRHAILDHTYTDRLIDVRLNGRSVGELGLQVSDIEPREFPAIGDADNEGGRCTTVNTKAPIPPSSSALRFAGFRVIRSSMVIRTQRRCRAPSIRTSSGAPAPNSWFA